MRSALSVAGFTVELVLDWVGRSAPTARSPPRPRSTRCPPSAGFGAMGLDFDDDYEVVEVEGTEEVEEAEEAKDEVERIEIADADDAWDGFRDADDSRRGGPRSALPTADDSREMFARRIARSCP